MEALKTTVTQPVTNIEHRLKKTSDSDIASNTDILSSAWLMLYYFVVNRVLVCGDVGMTALLILDCVTRGTLWLFLSTA